MESEKKVKVFSGNGFILVPWGEPAREGKFAQFIGDEVSTLVVLMSFENAETREAFPSLDTIAALAGMSKTTVMKCIDKLKKNNWFNVTYKRIGNGRSKNVYQMTYQRYTGGDSTGWIKIHHDIIRNGVWAIMPPSVRKLYLVMKAFCVAGSYADHGWLEIEEGDGSWYDFQEDFDFMPASVFDGFGKVRPYLYELCRIQDKTYRDAKKWLFDNDLIRYYEGDYCNGLAFPYDARRYAPKVLETMEQKKEQQAISRKGCTGHAKKAFRAMKVATMKVQSRKIAGDPRIKKFGEHAADSVPNSVVQ